MGKRSKRSYIKFVSMWWFEMASCAILDTRKMGWTFKNWLLDFELNKSIMVQEKMFYYVCG